MAKETKSILEEAILDAQRIEEALKANTKEILRAVSQEEIDAIVKESLEESEYVEEDVVTEDDEMEDDVEDEAGEAEADVEDDIDSVEGDDFESETGDVEGDESYEDIESDVDVEPVGDMGMSDDEEVMDMTSATDDEVISVYKKLSGEDEIEVIGDEIKLNVSEPGEYVIKTNNGAPSGMDAEPEMGMDADMGMDAGIGMDAEPEMGMGAEVEPEMGAEPEMGMDTDMGMDADYEDEEEVVYEVELNEDILKAALAEETKIGATANGNVRTSTGDVEKSMSGDLATGDIEGQKAPEGNENDDNWAGDNLEGGFDDDAVKHASAEGPMVMAESDDEDDDDDLSDEEKELIGTAGETGFELDESEEINEDDLEETAKVGGKVKYVGSSHDNEKLQKESNSKKYNALLTESKNLKKENEEFKKTLKTFRGMLAETVVFNSNLTYVTKLFVEHSVTKGEKKTILKRFDDDVTSIKESKMLYKTINNELKSRKPINETVNAKIIKGSSGSSTSKNLNEATAYVDASTTRIMDLINRVESREL